MNRFSFDYTPGGQINSRTTSNDAFADSAHYDVSRDYAVNGLNQYVSAGPAAFTYDLNGNLTGDGSVTFTYDVENRLVEAGGARDATVIYDPLGRLWEVAGTSTLTRFLYDGDALVAEYNASDTITERYVHGANAKADDPIVWYTTGTVSAATRRHLMANWQGSPALIADSSGDVINVNAWDAYGIPDAGNLGRFSYTGQIFLPEIGVYYYKARMYSPTLGRFLQTDPIGYEDQFNLYAYVANDPVNMVDPTGKAGTCEMCWSDLAMSGMDDDQIAGVQGAWKPYSEKAFWSFGAPLAAATTGYIAASAVPAVAAWIGSNSSRIVVTEAARRLVTGMRSHQRNIREHTEKLREYSKNPNKLDNKGKLANAPNKAVREKIIEGRKKVLRDTIKKHEREFAKKKEMLRDELKRANGID